MIKIESTQCPNCGAPIDEVNDKFKIRCTYCNSRLILTGLKDENYIDDYKPTEETKQAHFVQYIPKTAVINALTLIVAGFLIRPAVSLAYEMTKMIEREESSIMNGIVVHVLAGIRSPMEIIALFVSFVVILRGLRYLAKAAHDYRSEYSMD